MNKTAPMPDHLIADADLLGWLQKGQDLILLDASFTLPGTMPTAAEGFAAKRIPGAQFFDVDAVKDPTSPLPHMLPSPSDFDQACSALGITRGSRVVIYGQSGVVMGPSRAFWMFREYGHEQVYLLNGSLKSWEQFSGPIEESAPSAARHAVYEGAGDPAQVASLEDVQAALADDAVSIIDARAPDRFAGRAKEPRAGLRSGHMPGALNVPAGSLVNAETGAFLDTNQLAEKFAAAGYGSGSDMIMSCGSGVTACVLALGVELAGFHAARVYDGSWAEWGQESLQTKVVTGSPE